MNIILPAKQELLFAQGMVRIDILHGDDLSQVIRTIEVSNRIVTVGRAYLGLLVKGSEPAPTDIAVGTDNTTADDADTALGAQVFKDNITQRIDITDGVRLRFLLATSSANGNTLREAGVLGPVPNLFLLARVTHPDIVKSSSVAVNYTWDITFTQP